MGGYSLPALLSLLGRGTLPHRQQFSCAHQGYGQVCPRCAQQQDAKARAAQEPEQAQLERKQWQATFAKDIIDLQGLPKTIVLKARQVITEQSRGRDYRQFKGKRLNYDCSVISIPLTYSYRLICHDVGNRIEPRRVLSHEDDNVKKPKG